MAGGRHIAQGPEHQPRDVRPVDEAVHLRVLKKKAPPGDEQDEAEKKRELEKAAEEGVDSAHDFMRKFLKKSEGS